MYLVWFDGTDPRRKPPAAKLAEAHARYRQKFGAEPLVCLVHPDDTCDYPDIDVRPTPHLGRHCYWIGRDDD